MQVNKENHMATPGGAPNHLPNGAQDLENTNFETTDSSAQIDQIGNPGDFRWLRGALGILTGTALAVSFASCDAAERIQSFLNPGYAMSGEESPRRASIVGLNFDLDGLSEANIAAITEGEDSVFAGVRSRLAETYGDGVDFDLYYSLPPADGENREYIPFAADAEEDNADEEARDTITLSLDPGGDITPDNISDLIDGILDAINPRMEIWNYSTVAPTTGATEGGTDVTGNPPEGDTDGETTDNDPTTAGTDPPESKPLTTEESTVIVTSDSTRKPTTTSIAPNTTKKPESVPSRLVMGENVTKDMIASNGFLLEKTTANSGKLVPIGANGNFLVGKKNNTKDGFKSEGLTLYVWRGSERAGWDRIDVGNIKGMPGGVEGMCNIYIVTDPSQKPYSGQNGLAINGAYRFMLGDSNKSGLDFYQAALNGTYNEVPLNRDNFVVFQWDGKNLKQIS